MFVVGGLQYTTRFIAEGQPEPSLGSEPLSQGIRIRTTMSRKLSRQPRSPRSFSELLGLLVLQS